MSSTTSPSLLLRVRNPEDQDAWAEFLEIYTPIVRAYCFQRKIQAADIDDITQDVMSLIARSIQAFDYDPAKGRFRAWFGTVAANKIKTFVGKRSRQQEMPGQTVNTSTDTLLKSYSDPDTDWVTIFSERIFQTACGRIRPTFEETTWKCFEATWMRNEPAADIARTLGIPVHSVYVNKSRVLKRLESEVRLLADDVPVPENGRQGSGLS